MKKKSENSVLRYMLLRRLLPTFVLLASFLVFFCILLSMLSRHNERVQSAFQRGRMEQAVERLEEKLLIVDYAQRRIVNSRPLLQLAYMAGDMDPYTRFTLQNSLYKELSELRFDNDLVKSVYLYLPSPGIIISDAHAKTELADWCAECLSAGLTGMDEGPAGVVNAVTRFETLGGEERTATLFVLFDSGAMTRELEYVLGGENDSITLLTGHCPDSYADDGLFVRMQTLPLAVRYEEGSGGRLDAFVLYVVVLSVAFMGIVLLVEIVGLVLWFRQVYVPLDTLLTDAFGHMERGDLAHRIRLSGSSPFDGVYASYNHMMEKMEAYVETNLRQQILVSNANLKQLQTQINPHFMYNSYYILYHLIKKGDQQSSLRLAEYLGQFYRYVTRNADDEKRLIEEVEHARTYAAIQQFRFRETLQIEIDDPPEEIAGVYVPRMILQPLLENAFKYAYENSSDAAMCLRVRYDVRCARDFDIITENSGEVSEMTIAAICEKLRCTDTDIETTALVNIYRRLKIYFGEKAELRVDRSQLGGLRICMHIETEREAD